MEKQKQSPGGEAPEVSVFLLLLLFLLLYNNISFPPVVMIDFDGGRERGLSGVGRQRDRLPEEEGDPVEEALIQVWAQQHLLTGCVLMTRSGSGH